ncbi:DUF2570 domain-containing protein [Serratia proteamaculans]|uniref:DUF2570 domain-containing protein n=1 Tax=Serratia proteamaculans TaxID=28151 RepID=UPI001C865324|nr:DUF2570 domain-containing protein [Serratia proteamaculans]WEO91498.1 DUF2570 domain-containing protein [Serratia proteamaculans]
MKAVAILILLLLASLGGLGWQKHQREMAEKSRADAERALNQAGDVLAEVRALRADVSDIEAAMKTLGEKRSASGEQRRETIKTALVGETCATTLVPAAIAGSLQKRTAEVRTADYSGAFAGKPDSKH